MKIRKVSIISLIAVLFSIGVSAQKSSVETASLSIKTYKKESERNETRIHSLKEAKKHVDLAVKNETTANDPKMWLMRATTYMAIYSDKLGEGEKPVISVDNPVEIAVEAMINLHKSDAKKKYCETSDAYNLFVNTAVSARYIGDVAYNIKEYDKSVKYYSLTRSLIPYDNNDLLKRQNITDDAVLFSIATTTKLSGKTEDAKPYYIELIGKAYNDPWVYLDLYDIYLNTDNDTVKAIETIDAGRAIFDEDLNLRQQQIFIYSVSGRSGELIDILNGSIEDDPYNGSNYYIRGLLYLRMDDNDKALVDFEKAVENNEELMAAWSELGQLHYIQGADLTEEANALDLNETEKYNKLLEDAKVAYEKSIPCFIEIYEMSQDAKEKSRAAQFLMQMYMKTGQMDKYNEIKSQY